MELIEFKCMWQRFISADKKSFYFLLSRGKRNCCVRARARVCVFVCECACECFVSVCVRVRVRKRACVWLCARACVSMCLCARLDDLTCSIQFKCCTLCVVVL